MDNKLFDILKNVIDCETKSDDAGVKRSAHDYFQAKMRDIMNITNNNKPNNSKEDLK